jgi:uncharacterized protein (DUF1697 family)
MADYAAFLRGINVGGHRPVPMDRLKGAFEGIRFKNVRTLLASGNVLFETNRKAGAGLERTIEEKLKKTFGAEIGVLVRSREELQRLSDAQPFRGIPVTPQTRLYVTFLSEKLKGTLQIPYTSPDGNFKILRVSRHEVFSVATLSPEGRTVDLMRILEKEFGRKVTTRNWQTIGRILENYRV